MRWVFQLLSVVIVLWASSAHAAEARRPNVLFLMVDDLRPELGCYGTKLVKTPNLDALARAGVRFERAYCQYPLCNPSRSSLLTGRHPTTTGVLDNLTWFGANHPDFVSLPAHFKANGYAALRTGKIFHGGIDDADAWTEGGEPRRFEGGKHTLPRNPNQAQQSDRIVVLDGDGESHADYRTATRAIEYLRAHKEKPFFLACGFTKPHSPPTAPKRFMDLYDPAQIPLPPDFAGLPTVPTGWPKAAVPARSGDLFIGREATPEAAREMIRAYWASLTWTDWNVGRVMTEFDRLGLRDNTIVVLWGDHGYHLGEKGKWSKHGSLFEIGTRVPLIVIAPRARGNGKSSPRIVQSLDLYPTLAELCGLPKPAGLEGHSLAPLLANPSAKWEHPAFTVHGSNDQSLGVAVRTERYRYIEWPDGALLFDEQADPHELKNVADDPRLASVKAELSALAKRHRGPSTVPNAGGDLFTRGNLVAWCIVPFDSVKRGPEQRAAMLQRLGFTKFAYDYRAEHVPTFDAELTALKRHGIELFAWWFPTTLNDEARHILDVLKRHTVKPQLWVTGGGEPTRSATEQQTRIEAEAARIRPIAAAAAQIGAQVGLYNHGGWFGEPENQLAVIARLGMNNVGLVYNLHHGHDHLDRFAELLEKMKPHLLALNLNGMVQGGDKLGQKILQLGQGDHDLALLRTIRASGYRGPIGILGHTMDDAEARLLDNLDGLDWLRAQLNGQPPGPRPTLRTVGRASLPDTTTPATSAAPRPQ